MSEAPGRLAPLAAPDRHRPRLPPLTGALDSSDDSARYASREYRNRQAKRRRRAKLEASRASDSADNATLRSQGALDDSAAGDTTYRREASFDTSYRRETSTEPGGHRRDLSADLSYRRDPSISARDPSVSEGAPPELGSEAAELSIADELSRLGEDVRSGSEAGGDRVLGLMPEHAPEPAVTRLYIEKGSRFQAAKRPTAARSAGTAYAKRSPARAVELALRTQRVFAPLGRLCCGLLAGLALAHLMFVVALTRGDPLTFAAQYSPLALPFRAVFFTLCAVCCVAALDRYDVGRASAGRLRRSLTLQDGGVTVLLYLAALALSTCLAPTDDRLHLYRRATSTPAVASSAADIAAGAGADVAAAAPGASTSAIASAPYGLWESHADARADCRLMVALCAARAALVLAAWLVVAANPALDRVLDHLGRLSAAGEAEEPQVSVATVS